MSITFQVTRELAASPHEIFSALTSPESAGEWMPGLVRMERLGAPGDISLGSRWRETRRMMGKEASEEFEVTEFDPPTRLALRVDGKRGSSGSGEYRFSYTLTPTVIGTLVTLDGEIRGLTGVTAVMGPVFKGMYKRGCAKDLDALACFLHAQPPAMGGDYPAPQRSSASRTITT